MSSLSEVIVRRENLNLGDRLGDWETGSPNQVREPRTSNLWLVNCLAWHWQVNTWRHGRYLDKDVSLSHISDCILITMG
jgi:hypothetical protein